MKKHFLIATSLIVGMLVSCHPSTKNEGETKGVPAIDLSSLDTAVSPRQDFYQFVNGKWMVNNPLKPEYGRYGTFDILRDSSLSATNRIVQSLNGEPGTDKYKAMLLYQMAMDTAKLNTEGVAPVTPDLAAIDAIKGKGALIDYLAMAGNYGFNPLFSTYVSADSKDSDKNLLALYQPGLIMGDIDYYTDNAAYTQIQDAYLAYISKIFVLAGTSKEDADQIAKRVLDTEKSLSKILYTKLEERDPDKTYNKLETKDFFRSFTFPWRTYFSERTGLNGTFNQINVAEKGFFQKFDKWYANADLEDLKLLIKAKLLSSNAAFLSDDFRNASFDFFGRTLSGVKKMKPRWKNAVSLVNGTFGDVISQIYVSEYFPPESKEKVIHIIDNLRSALKERIGTLTWMSDSTKVRAIDKLSNFKVKVGYPDKWKSYNDLKVDTTSLYGYLKNISLFETNDNIADLKKPVDRAKWLMNAFTVNAYYNPTTNEITFPAAILQPPFFNKDADDPVNYGAIGVVIGHEMTHGFDDSGSKFDKFGNINNWWTAADKEKFDELTKKLAEQYSQIIVTDTVHANGFLTLGENIADQGGLLVSHAAMRKAVKDTTTLIDGYTPDQRFFIAYARLWGQNVRKAEMLRLTKMDVHSLGKWRVNQALKNIPSFYNAFNVQPGDSMYLAPKDRVIVW